MTTSANTNNTDRRASSTRPEGAGRNSGGSYQERRSKTITRTHKPIAYTFAGIEKARPDMLHGRFGIGLCQQGSRG